MAPPKADWRLFHDTGVLVVSGRTSELYPGVTPGYPFLYPPPFVWHVALLGFLSPAAAHIALVVVMFLALVAALWMLHRGLDDQDRRLESWIFVVLSSASCAWMVTAGHIAAWFVLLISAGLLLWRNGREVAAGFVLGLVAIKPHYCLPILGCIVLARGWRVLGGALAGISFLALTTIPLGREVWASYFSHFATGGQVAATIPPWKQITLLAFWRSVLGDTRPTLVTTATVLTVLPCVALVGLAWLRRGANAKAIPRLFAVTVLMVVSSNVYAFHYDGLLLAIAGAVWFLRGQDYVSPRRHLAIGVTILLVYVAQFVPTFFVYGGVAVTGLLLAAWLVLDALDLLAAPRPSAVTLTTAPTRGTRSSTSRR